jgi:predicted kinase
MITKPTLYLMLGYPGAGKTTVSKIIHELTGATHLWADKIRNERFQNPTHNHNENLELYKFLNEMTAELLDKGQSVIFDTAFNFYKDRVKLREIATRSGAKTQLIWVKTDINTSKARAIQNKHSVKNTYSDPMSVERFDRISGDLEPPTKNEEYIEVIGKEVTKEKVMHLLGQY